MSVRWRQWQEKKFCNQNKKQKKFVIKILKWIGKCWTQPWANFFNFMTPLPPPWVCCYEKEEEKKNWTFFRKQKIWGKLGDGFLTSNEASEQWFKNCTNSNKINIYWRCRLMLSPLRTDDIRWIITVNKYLTIVASNMELN